jgi:hypothetical protein
MGGMALAISILIGIARCHCTYVGPCQRDVALPTAILPLLGTRNTFVRLVGHLSDTGKESGAGSGWTEYT